MNSLYTAQQATTSYAHSALHHMKQHAPSGLADIASQMTFPTVEVEASANAKGGCLNKIASGIQQAFWSVVGFPKVVWGCVKNFFSYIASFFQSAKKEAKPAANAAPAPAVVPAAVPVAAQAVVQAAIVAMAQAPAVAAPILAPITDATAKKQEIMNLILMNFSAEAQTNYDSLLPAAKDEAMEAAYNKYRAVMHSHRPVYTAMTDEERKNAAIKIAVKKIVTFGVATEEKGLQEAEGDATGAEEGPVLKSVITAEDLKETHQEIQHNAKEKRMEAISKAFLAAMDLEDNEGAKNKYLGLDDSSKRTLQLDAHKTYTKIMKDEASIPVRNERMAAAMNAAVGKIVKDLGQYS